MVPLYTKNMIESSAFFAFFSLILLDFLIVLGVAFTPHQLIRYILNAPEEVPLGIVLYSSFQLKASFTTAAERPL